jgi:hypothetical protein
MKKVGLFIFLFALLSCLNTFAQLKYEQELLINEHDILYSQTYDSLSGNFIASGTYTKVGKINSKNIMVVSWDDNSMGYNKIYHYSGSSARDDEGRFIKSTSDRGFLVVGNTNSFKSGTDFDGFIMKLNSNYRVSWFKKFGGNYADYALSACEDDSCYYVSGYLTESSGSTYKGAVICLYKSTGNVKWSRTYKCQTSNYYQVFSSIIIGFDGNLIVSGYVLTPANNLVCASINKSNGNIIWSYRYSASTTNLISSNIQMVDNGCYLITGIRNYSSTTGDVLLAKINSTGNVAWAKYYDKGGIDYGTQTIYNNRYITTGYTKSFGNEDVFLMNTDTAGTLSYLKIYKFGSTNEGQTSVLGTRPLLDLNSRGFALVNGRKNSSGVFNSYMLSMNSSGNTGCQKDTTFTTTTFNLTRSNLPDSVFNLAIKDTLVIMDSISPAYDSVCASSLKSITKSLLNENSTLTDFNVYPNPTQDKVEISINGDIPENTEIAIFDMNGKMIYRQSLKFNEASVSIDMSGYGRGLYFVQLQSESYRKVKKVCVY